MTRKTFVKYLTTEQPTNPDTEAIKVLIESIGYQVQEVKPLYGGMMHVYLTSATQFRGKNFGKVKRKIEQRLPIKAYSTGYNNQLNAPFFTVEMDRSRSIDGINDLLSTFRNSRPP